jgi:CBS domain-containing protein
MELSRFERRVAVTDIDENVIDAARRMRDAHVGCLVAVRDGRPVGMLTDRDIAVRVVAEGLDVRTTRVSAVVTYEAATLLRSDGIDTAVTRMRDTGVRRLPIVDDDGRLVGIITADDIIQLLTNELHALGESIAENVDSSESK